MINDITAYDENTLEKIHCALADEGFTRRTSTDMINAMQKAGILFRERAEVCEKDGVSDGYHTFGELYEHRRALTAALAAERADISWRSKAHHPDDSPMFEGGYFIVGIDTPAGTVTYHYKLSHWDDFSEVPELEHAPKWDGAPPEATVTRLLGWAKDDWADVAARQMREQPAAVVDPAGDPYQVQDPWTEKWPVTPPQA